MKSLARLVFFGGLLIFANPQLVAQKLPHLKGDVFELTDEKQKEFLVGANVYWKDGNVGTVTDQNGKFEIERIDSDSVLTNAANLNPALHVQLDFLANPVFHVVTVLRNDAFAVSSI